MTLLLIVVVVVGLAVFTTVLGGYGSALLTWGGDALFYRLRYPDAHGVQPPAWEAIDLVVAAVSLGGIYGLVRIAVKVANRIVTSTAQMTTELETPPTVLIMGLSKIKDENDPKPGEPESAQNLVELTEPSHLQDLVLNTHDFKERNQNQNRPEGSRILSSPWQQNIRSIHAHRNHLKRVIVIPSEQSVRQSEQFKAYFSKLFGADSTITLEFDPRFSRSANTVAESTSKRSIYEHYDFMYNNLRRIVREVTMSTYVTEEQVCIDCTSGQKTFSIAAAMVTLNTKTKMSYLNPDGEAKFYDMRVDFAGFMG